jgi:hypothetical protein
MEVEQAYQKLEMRQKYWCRKMYDSVAKDLGGDAVKWFMQCNIRQDISIKVAPNSWMPKTEEQKAIGFEKFLAVAGQIIMAKNDPKMLDEVLRKANEVYGGEINFNDFETDNVEAQLRLDKLREVGAFVEQQLADLIYDPEGGVNGQALLIAYSQTAEMLRLNHTQADPADIFFNLPMDVMFDTHAEFENAYTDWLKTAEGRGASVFVRTLVRQLAEYHIQAESYRLMKIKQYSMPAKLPDLEEELAVNDATHNQEMVQTADKTEQQMLYSGIQNALMPPAEGKTSQKPR